MRGIGKRFGAAWALDGVDFELRPGEIHALVGENGAGKTTLMNVLTGLYRPDRGRVEVEGRSLPHGSPRRALAAGIGMVHQHFMLVRGQTVAENVALGLPGIGFFPRWGEIRREVAGTARRYGLPVDPDALVRQLSVGQRQRVEILKLLHRRVRILVLDEPTSVLTPGETADLFATLTRIREEGGAVVIISHKLAETVALADRVTVLRAGRRVATLPAGEVSVPRLAELMVGRGGDAPRVRREAAGDETILALEGIWAEDYRGAPALRGLDLEIRRGEIFGVLGVAGNGQRELVEVVTGLRAPARGQVRVGGRDLGGRGPRDFIRAGVAHIPEDRHGLGVVPGMTLTENLHLKDYREAAVSAGPLLDTEAMEERAADAIRAFGITPAHPGGRAGALSGGNLQRLIAARELSRPPLLLAAAYPFQGLDRAAAAFLADLLAERAGNGLAVLLVGDDLETTLEVSHRVGVLYRGSLRGVRLASRMSLEEAGRLMAGHGTGEETG
jgi:simple sugar transport system ATP-binding protein